MWKRLFRIFGPVILAGVIVFLLLISPYHFGFGHTTPEIQKRAAVSLAPRVLKEKQIKSQALSHNYVPFFGSSEWERIDPMHPSVLAQKYHRNYRPFLLGSRGTQSLTQFFVMQNITKDLRNKKAVISLSPQWFVKGGTRKDAFGFYYSQLQTTDWLSHEHNSAMNRYAAKRLLTMPSATSDKILLAAIQRVAAGKPLTGFEKSYVNLRHKMLTREDLFFCSLYIKKNNELRVNKEAKKLPKTDNQAKLNALAERLGKADTSNNRFRISNKFYATRVSHHLRALKGFQSNLSYLRSPEYSDFELLLNMLAKYHTKAIFVLPPINQRWQKFTGLPQSSINDFDTKIKHQLHSQGFNNILDLSHDGNKPYFMADTIHYGWKGWLAFDKGVNPFLSKPQPAVHYHINPRYYSKGWQNAGLKQIKNYG
ncbi:MAG: D-alanyl-lipoteichoic acid biosynthesis protein DltD [Liquorilactobacillus satsumensis]|uniref:D-alanyl-lipoteichoic acid biosynthesis protein DltD n=1 Tax=Liquorilactobacillus satsumensis TaxID=259059 RepID=UPI0039ED7CDB